MVSDHIFSFIKAQTHEHLHIKRCLVLYPGSALTCSSTALPAVFSQLLCAESLSCLTTNSRKLWLPTYHSNKQNSLEKNNTVEFMHVVLFPQSIRVPTLESKNPFVSVIAAEKQMQTSPMQQTPQDQDHSFSNLGCLTSKPHFVPLTEYILNQNFLLLLSY